jgi:hypothetical protein
MMNDSTRVPLPPRRALPRAARTAAAVIAAATLALPAAAFGGESTSARLVAFARCVRAHGVARFPDPPANATNTKFPGARELGVSNSQLSAAEKACEYLLPAGIDDQFPPAEVRLLLNGMLRFSQCMRHDGVPNWPDPTTDSEGRPEFPLDEVPGTNRDYWRSPRMTAKERQCERLLPSALGGIPVG